MLNSSEFNKLNLLSEKINIIIISFLSVTTVACAVVRNYHFVKYNSVKDDEYISLLTLLQRIIGSRTNPIIWIFPLSINEARIDAEADHHKMRFNKLSKVFRLLLLLIILYIVIVMFATG